MPDAEPLVIGEKYRVVRPIGKGGMGAVFEAEHTLTGRRVAVKVLLPQFVANEVLAKRFVNEARAAARIQDPHVVEVVDLGRTPAGELYQVLEYLDGRELKAAIRAEAPFPLGRACHIAAQMASLMGKAHALGIVHRDLKPANVFLLARDRDDDYVKVLDFGIAKLRPVQSGEGDFTQLTGTQDVVGTPLYMAPEQLKGSREVDGRADVYSLGVVLFQMLSARLPFTGDSMADIFLKVMTESPPPLAQLRPDLPPALVAAVERAIDRDPLRRFADGAALAEALAPWASTWSLGGPRTAPGYAPGAIGPVTGTTPAPGGGALSPVSLAPSVSLEQSASPEPPPPPAPRRWPWGAAVGGVALVLVSVWTWSRGASSTPTPPAPLRAPAAAHLAAVAPDAWAPPAGDAAAVTSAPDAAAALDVAVGSDAAPTRDVPRRSDAGRGAARRVRDAGGSAEFHLEPQQ